MKTLELIKIIQNTGKELIMELELGLKITRTREDVSSSVDFRFSKDPFGPLVLSRETDSRFIIIIHLKGFKKEGIEIEINKEGNRITIRGRKPVEELVLIRWMAWRKEVEFRVFRKVFRIPDIVDLDKIKARFDDDDATLTITMPKRVKGISGFRIEEEDEEERLDEVEEESIDREESDEQTEKFETEFQREERFGEIIMEDKERESQVLGEEQKDEEETEVDDLDNIHQIDDQDKNLDDSNTESGECSFRKLPDIERYKEQELVVEKQAETKSDDDFGSRAYEEIEEQEPDEQLDRASESGAMEIKTTDDDGLSKVQRIEEPERDNDESKIHDMVEQETSGQEKKNRDDKEDVDGKMGEGFTPNIDRTHVVGEDGIAETETKAEEFESVKLEADEVYKIYELVDKKEEEGQNGKMRRRSEDKSFKKHQENEEQHSKGQTRQDKQEEIKELVEERTPKADANIGNDIPKPVQEIEVPEVDTLSKTGDEGKEQKEKKKSVNTEIENGDVKEEVDAKMGEGSTPNIAEAETKSEEFESDKLKADEVEKIQKSVEKKEEEEENAKVGTQSEDINLIKLQEIGEQQFQGQKRHKKQEKIKELVEDQTLEAETSIANDSTKQVQEIEVPEVYTLGKTGDEENAGKQVMKSVKMEINSGDAKEEVDAKMGEGFAPNVSETETKAEEFESDKLKADEVDKRQKLVEKKEEEKEYAKVGIQNEDISLIKPQEIGEQRFQEQERHDKQEKIKELMEEKTPERETNIANDSAKQVQERCEGKHKIQKLFQEETTNQPKEYKEKIMETGKKINDAGVRKVQEIIRQQELDEPARCKKESKTRESVNSKSNDKEKEEKEIAETKTKEQDSYRPKILGEQEEIQELAEEKTNFLKNGKVKEEEEIAVKKTEFGDDDDIPRKVRETEQRDSNAMKGKEEKGMIQELVLEEKISDGGIENIAVAETKAENGKLKKVQEIDEQQLHEEDTCGKQFQELIGGEISGVGEVEDVEKEKKTIEAEKKIRDSTKEAQEIEKRDSDVSGKYIKGTTIQELKKNRGIYQNEHEEEEAETDRPGKITGMIEQELVNLNSELEQDNVEDGEKTQELVKEKIKDSEDEEGIEESRTKTNDDVIRKVQGIKEHELYEPKRKHVSKVKELVEEKTGAHKTEKEKEKEIAESEKESEYGGLRKVDGSEEHELHQPKIHKERDKTQITGTEEQSGQKKEEKEEKIIESIKIIENENSVDVQEIKKERPDKLQSHENEKRYKIQEVVEVGHNDRKEEQQEEKVMVKAKLETEEESSTKVQEIEQQEYDGLKRSMVQDKMQETEDSKKNRAMEEKKILARRTKPKGGDSLRKIRDDEDPELSEPYKKQKEDKIQEVVEMGTSDYREKVKKQDEDDILRSQEAGRPDLDESERHGEQSNILKLGEEEKVENIAELGEKMEDDSSSKFHEFKERKSYEDWTHEEQKKRKDLAKEEATDPKDKHTGGESHNDHKEEKQEEKVIAKAELKTEEDSSKKVLENKVYDGLKRAMVQDEMQETEENEKTRAMEENEIVERRKKIKDGSLRKVREGEDPELGRHKRHVEEDRIQELVETVISDHREKVKKKDGDDILQSQETEKLDLGELDKHCKQRNIHQSVEDEKGEEKMENISEPGGKWEGDSSGKFHEFQKQKSYEDWRQEESEEIENLVDEDATDPKDKHIGGGGGGGEHKEERYEKGVQTKTKVGDEINKKVGEDKEPESDKHEQYRKLDKLEGVLKEGEIDHEKEEENLMDDFTTKIQETEKEESHELEMQEKLDIVPDFVENKTGDQEDEEAEESAAVVASDENRSSRKVQTIEEEESEKHKEQNKIPETSDPEVKEEEDEERVAKKERKEEEVPNARNVRDTNELIAHVQELEGKTENYKDDDGVGRRGEKGKQVKTAETMSTEMFKTKSDDDIVRKLRETKVQESNEKKNQERKGEIDELERKKTSIHEVKPVTEDDSLRKGQDFLENESNVSKRRPVEQEKIQELEVGKRDRVNEDEEKAEAGTKINDGKSNKLEMSQKLELDESEANEEHKRIWKPLEEKSNAPEKEKEGNEKIAEEEMQYKIDRRIKDQEIIGKAPYEIQKNGQHDEIPEYLREEEKGMEQREIEEMKRTAENVSSRKVQQIKDELEKHLKPSEIPEKHNIQDSLEEKTHGHGEQETNEGSKIKEVLKTKTMASSESQDVKEKGSDQQKRYAEQEVMTEEDGKEEYQIIPQKEINEERIQQVESKANDDTKVQESTGLRGQNKKGNHQELVEIETSDQRKEEKKEDVAGRAETLDEYDSSRKIHKHEERKSDKLERHGEEEMSEKLAEEETHDDKEGDRAGAKIIHDGFGKVRDIEEQEQDKKQSFVEKDISGKAKENKNQETKSRDDSSEKTQRHEQKRYEEQDKKNLGLVGEKTNYCRNEENDKEDKEIAEAEVPRKLKGIEKQELTKMVERHENRDKIKELVEEEMKNLEGEDKKSMITKVMAKAEDHESKGAEGLRIQDKSREQRLSDNFNNEETRKTETKSKESESRKIHQIKEQEETSEQERTKEQGRIKELVEDRTHYYREKENRETEFEDGSSKKIQEKDKEEPIESGRDEKRDKIQEPMDRETSEDDEEELEVEFEDEEEDWEAEVIQEMDSDEDNDKFRQINRIRLGFRLVGGSTLFMSLIVIVIRFIRSKRKIRCYRL